MAHEGRPGGFPDGLHDMIPDSLAVQCFSFFPISKGVGVARRMLHSGIALQKNSVRTTFPLS